MCLDIARHTAEDRFAPFHNDGDEIRSHVIVAMAYVPAFLVVLRFVTPTYALDIFQLLFCHIVWDLYSYTVIPPLVSKNTIFPCKTRNDKS